MKKVWNMLSAWMLASMAASDRACGERRSSRSTSRQVVRPDAARAAAVGACRSTGGESRAVSTNSAATSQKLPAWPRWAITPAVASGPIRNMPDMWAARCQPAWAEPICCSMAMNTICSETNRAGMITPVSAVSTSR